jgi:hypothetical protein
VAAAEDPSASHSAGFESGLGEEEEGLSLLRLGAILCIIAFATVWIGLLSIDTTNVTLTAGSSSAASSIDGSLNELEIVAAIGLVLTAGGAFVLGLGFRKLSEVEDGFSTASILTFLGVAGGLLGLFGVLSVVGGIENAVSCIANAAGPAEAANCPAAGLGSAFGGLILLALAGLLGLLMAIGILLGCLHLRDRQDSGLALGAGVLVLIGAFVPFLAVIGFILLLIALGSMGAVSDDLPLAADGPFSTAEIPRSSGRATSPPVSGLAPSAGAGSNVPAPSPRPLGPSPTSAHPVGNPSASPTAVPRWMMLRKHVREFPSTPGTKRAEARDQILREAAELRVGATQEQDAELDRLLASVKGAP